MIVPDTFFGGCTDALGRRNLTGNSSLMQRLGLPDIHNPSQKRSSFKNTLHTGGVLRFRVAGRKTYSRRSFRKSIYFPDRVFLNKSKMRFQIPIKTSTEGPLEPRKKSHYRTVFEIRS